MKIRSAVPENGCLIVLVDGKKTKKNKKTTAKHIRIRLLPEGGCVKNELNRISSAAGPMFDGTVTETSIAYLWMHC